MAAINMNLAARSEQALHHLVRRQKNWAQREPGVIVVLVIVFLVLILVIAMFINKRVRPCPSLLVLHSLTCIYRDKPPSLASSLPSKDTPSRCVEGV